MQTQNGIHSEQKGQNKLNHLNVENVDMEMSYTKNEIMAINMARACNVYLGKIET